MANESWDKAKRVFADAIKIAPDQRLQFLDEVCAGDAETHREVKALLDSLDDAGSFMENPAAHEVSAIFPQNIILEAGKSFGHYEIVKQIGAGGMGEVYLAKDTRLDRKVAIKILNERISRQEANLERFVKEAKAASSLNHPNILVIHEIGLSDEANYIVSEYIEGETLRGVITETNLKLSEILEIAVQISNALAAAHTAKIVHRDIKPENIIVRPDGFVKILDFGLAKLIEQKAFGLEAKTIQQNETAKGLILGTVNYMSPEQAKGGQIDGRTDIFSFGVLLYEMIAGRTPFAGDSMSETFANLINSEPPALSRFAPNVPDELQSIIAKTLRKNKDDRYQTMKGLLADLKSLQKRLDFEEFVLSEPSAVADGLSRKSGMNNLIAPETDLQPPATADGSDIAQKSIAVLPFANMSADAENEYFCDGLAEELLNALAKIKDLKVAARTSSFAFKNRNVAVSTIGNALNVSKILEGSVRKIGNRVRISVQLINVADGFHLWSERYDGELKDIFDLQDKITLAVIDKLKVNFLSEEKLALRDRYDENVEAYELYLKGRYHYLKLRPDEIQKGISYFEQAIALDPNYALAYAGLAQALQTLPLAAELPGHEFFPKAKAAALRAIEIDDTLAEAHAILGWLLFWFEWDWNAAEAECRRAIELDPKSADAREAYAHLLSNTGRHSESLSEIELARELDPVNLRINAFVGQFLLHAGKIDEALAVLQKTAELEPNFWLSHLFASSAYIEKEMFSEAFAEAEKARQLSGGSTHAAALGIYALAKANRFDEAAAALSAMQDLSASRHVPPYHFALAFQGLDKREEALAWLESGFQQNDPKMVFLKVEPKWNSLRHESRFVQLIERMSLA